jgi:hypothetical protein
MNISIGDLNKAEVFIALYNAAPSPNWMTTFTRRPESQKKLGRDFLEN